MVVQPSNMSLWKEATSVDTQPWYSKEKQLDHPDVIMTLFAYMRGHLLMANDIKLHKITLIVVITRS